MPSLYLKLALLAAWMMLTLGLGWAALHEYGVAHSQAARDQASYAVAQAHATANALRRQQAIDAQQLAEADKQRAQAEQAVANAMATVHAAEQYASAARHRVRVIVRAEPVGACARQPIPRALLEQIRQR